MIKLRHPWVRYWLPARSAADVRAFTPDDVTLWPSEYRTLVDLAETPCLILLGEPGMGKTVALEDEKDRLSAAGQAVAHHDLKAVEGLSDIFGDDDGVIFLDSLDEGRMVINRLTNLLPKRLQDYCEKHPCLRFRITCRSAEWPPSLTDALSRIFGKDNVQTYVLCPLRRQDVIAAAQAMEIDGQVFLADINRIGAEALAAKPVTLDMLLRLQAEHGALPVRLADLYRDAMPLLATDPSDWRQEERRVGEIDPERRVALARRIAALSIFGQSPFISMNERSKPAGTLALADITRPPDTEPYEGSGVPVARTAVEEVLCCGLFKGAGGNTVGWAHQTYAEFLAAEFVVNHDLPLPQIMALLVPGTDTAGRLAPQMRAFAAWLITLRPALAEPLLAANPDALVRSDIVLTNDDLKNKVAAAYLAALSERRIEDGRLDFWRLANPGLGRVLRPYLTDAGTYHAAVYGALEMAEQCRCGDLWDDLLALAKDTAQWPGYRRNAVAALVAIDLVDRRDDFLPFCIDSDDEVLAAALRHLWQTRHIPLRQVLQAIRPPNSRVIGFYRLFLRDELAASIASAELPEALNWMAQFIARHPNPFAKLTGEDEGELPRLRIFLSLAEKLFQRGMASAADGAVQEAIVALVVTLVGHPNWVSGADGGGFGHPPEDDAVRRAIVLRSLCALGDAYPLYVLVHYMRLVTATDVPWLLASLDKSRDGRVREALADLTVRVWSREDEQHANAIYDACDRHPELERLRLHLFGYIALGGTEERYAREDHAHSVRREASEAARKPEKVAERIQRLAVSACDGNADAWILIVAESGLNNGLPSAAFYPHMNDAARDQLAQAARRYLEIGDPGLLHWWSEADKGACPALAGYVALDYLSDRLADLPAELWVRWAPAVVGCSLNDGGAEERANRIAKLCYAAAPDAFEQRVRERALTEVRAKRQVAFSDLLKGVWSDRISDTVASVLTYPTLDSDYSLSQGLSLLLSHGHPFASSMVRAAVEGRIRGNRRITVLHTALTQGVPRTWEDLWPLLASDADLARQFIGRLGAGASALTGLTADQIIDLYLLRRALSAADPSDASGGWDGTMVMLPGTILNILVQRGDESACAALERAVATGDDGAARALVRCREQMLRNTWQPLEPAHLLALIAGRDRRHVSSGEELLDLLQDSLARYQDELHGVGHRIDELWNVDKKDLWPKDESAFSRSVQRHLKRDLADRHLVVNREVEVHVRERDDIQVDAIDPRTGARITVIIEAKCCWNGELFTAMEAQLTDRYLADADARYGLYLVPRFQCDAWKKKGDQRRADSLRQAPDLPALREALEQKAVDLSASRGKSIRSVVIDARWPS